MPSSVRAIPSSRVSPGYRWPLKRAAMARAKPNGQIDGRFLTLDLPEPLLPIGMREVRREADHRGDLPGLLDGVCDGIDIGRGEAGEKSRRSARSPPRPASPRRGSIVRRTPSPATSSSNWYLGKTLIGGGMRPESTSSGPALPIHPICKICADLFQNWSPPAGRALPCVVRASCRQPTGTMVLSE